VNARRTEDWTPLHLASYYGEPEIVRALLDHGASVNAENGAGETPLYVVSRGVYHSQGDGACITRLLLERGGNANARGKDHSTSLNAASYTARPEIVRILLDHGANPHAKTRQGKDSLDLVSRGEYGPEEDGVRVAQLLLERGVDANSQDKDRWTPLHSACQSGRPEIVRLLLDHGAKVDAENDDGETPLSIVSGGEYRSRSKGVRIAQLLLERGADVNGKPRALWTPLTWASYRGRLDIVRLLVDRGARLNVKIKFRTPLHALSGGEYESQEDGARIAQLLLERGADVNAQEMNRETPLFSAAFFGKIELARVFLDHGAIVTAEGYDGQTPLHALSRGKCVSQDVIRLAQLLVERGADVNAPDQVNDTPLHSACYAGKLDIA
jgi:ankyrin repeat protein